MRVHGVCVNTVQACALRAASRARVGESVTLRPEGVRDCARTGSPILALHKAGAHKCAGCPARRGGEGCSHRACRIVSVLTLFYSTCRCYRRSLAHAHTSTLADTLLEAARSVCAREPQHGSLHKCAGVERSKSPQRYPGTSLSALFSQWYPEGRQPSAEDRAGGQGKQSGVAHTVRTSAQHKLRRLRTCALDRVPRAHLRTTRLCMRTRTRLCTHAHSAPAHTHTTCSTREGPTALAAGRT